MNKYNFIPTLILLLSILGPSLLLRAMDMSEANKHWTLSQNFTEKIVMSNDYDIIKKTTNLDNLQRLAKAMIYINRTPNSTTTLAKAMARIDELEQTHNTPIPFDKNEGENALSELILNYAQTVDENGKPTSTSNLDLPRFVTWFINHGIPVTKDAMCAAILENRIDVVSILRHNGINPQEPYSDNKTMNFIQYARSKNQATIAAILEAKEEEHSTAWYIALQRVVNTIENQHHRAATTQDVLQDVQGLGDVDFSQTVSQFNRAEQQLVKTHLLNTKSAGYEQKIWVIDSHTPPSSASFFGLKAAAGVIAAVLTASAFYKWVTRSPKPSQAADVLINNTGKAIFVSDERNKSVQVDPQKAYELPKSGTLSITTDNTHDEPDLTIDLNTYVADRTEQYLNISISKNWLSWLFGPLRYSARWVDKAGKESE